MIFKGGDQELQNNKLNDIDPCNWACNCLSVSRASALTRTPVSFIYLFIYLFSFFTFWKEY